MRIGPLHPKTPADLLVPVDPLACDRRSWIAQQQKLFDTVREYIDHPRSTQAGRLQLLSRAVPALAQVQVFLGVPAEIAFEHATEVLEGMFVSAAVRDTPALEVWFGRQ
jgi:hypothetical protein